MTRRCSHCSNNGHNSRTCPTRVGAAAPGGGGLTGCSGGGSGSGGGGVKLFGVRLTDGSIMKKSASMGNLSHYHSSSSAAASPNPSSPSSDPFQDPVHVPDGYLSDDPNHASCSTNRRAERKKGVPWTEEEHRLFLLGLQKLGKGDWRGISRNFVTSRTPTQVASHAQKYFIRQTNATRRKRRSSLFDMVPETASEALSLAEEQFLLPPQVVDSSKEQFTTSDQQAVDDDGEKSMPSLDLSLKPDFEPMETTPSEVVEEIKESVTSLPEIPPVAPSFFPALIPIPFALWPPNIAPLEEEKSSQASHHQILRPIPVLPKEPVNVDALVGMSQLSLVENGSAATESTRLSLKLTSEPSRQSAFHASTPLHGSGVTKDNNSSFPAV
ncbi:OLC1v1014875C1 [Oldenlandia corymbosa var. corymbosa]|uniref:OLC1v1014875C1 n=1 Tax=Oldenlandia corymbosa var. corymbosa TaxID=529605 RepID=A0AAV1E454_OLDCO|nr:OLC1v1014875C1 [Oldenlandia corymbosa var. corymbosa]